MTTHSSRSTTAVGRDSRADMAQVVDSIRSIVQSLRISGRAVEQKLGISSAQLYILQELADRPAQSINELAENTFTHQSSVSMVVSRLVDERLVSRSSSPGDARKLSISLTPAGRALVRKAPNAAQTRLMSGLKTFSRGELRALSGYLNSLASVIGEQTAADKYQPAFRQKMARRA
jgi:DNA-binding MarR family transcriptional regulator